MKINVVLTNAKKPEVKPLNCGVHAKESVF